MADSSMFRRLLPVRGTGPLKDPVVSRISWVYLWALILFVLVTGAVGWLAFPAVQDSWQPAVLEAVFGSMVATLIFSLVVGLATTVSSVRNSMSLPLDQRVLLLFNATDLSPTYRSEILPLIHDMVIVSSKTETRIHFLPGSQGGNTLDMHVVTVREMINLTHDHLSDVTVSYGCNSGEPRQDSLNILGCFLSMRIATARKEVFSDQIPQRITRATPRLAILKTCQIDIRAGEPYTTELKYWTVFQNGESYSISRHHFTERQRVRITCSDELDGLKLKVRQSSPEGDHALTSQTPVTIELGSLRHRQSRDVFALEWS